MKRFKSILTLILLFLLCAGSVYGSVKPLPRIKARTHSPYPEFYNSVTDAKFVPEGNAYVRLYEASDDNKYHATFIDELYDANDAEAALEDMADSGYNVVYVFIQGGGSVLNAEGKYGTGGDDIDYNEPNLYEPSMDNFMDFLEKANENEIYVFPVLITWPYNHYYRSRASRPEDDPNLEHKNRWYLADGAQEAKEIYCEYFVKYIKDTNPALLSTVFAYIVEAEICCLSDYKPFSMSSGTVSTADGNSYDMAVKSERQACQDNNTNLWANRCVDAIHKVDPAAMATASVFTFKAASHDGHDGLWPPNPNPNYPRWPARPLKLVSTRLSFIDIHIYPGWDSMTTLLNSSEWGSIDKTVKPFLIGEFGAHTDKYATPAAAAPVLSDWRVEAYNKGFTASLLWTWDSNSIELAHWNAKDNSVINNALSPDLRPDHWEFNTNNDFEGWTLSHDMANASVSGGLLSFDLSGPDPYIYSPAGLNLPSTQYDYFVVKMKNPTSDDSAVLYWIRDDDTTWNGTKSRSFSIEPNDTGLTEYVFYLGDHDEWKDTIERVRLDPVHYLGTWDEEPNHFEIDYMKLSGEVVTLPHVSTILDANGEIFEMFMNEDDDLDYCNLGNPSEDWDSGWDDFNSVYDGTYRIKPLGVGDIDEDGYEDMLVLTGGGYVFAILNDGNGITKHFLGRPCGPQDPNWGGGWSMFNSDNSEIVPLGVGDINGDGNDDIVVHTVSGYIYVLWTDGSSLTGNSNLGQPCGPQDPNWGGIWDDLKYNASDPNYWKPLGVGDINGDGFDDIVFIDPNGEIYTIWTDGTKLTGYSSIGNPKEDWGGGWDYFYSKSNLLKSLGVSDVDQDGLDDVVVLSGSGYVIVLWSDGSSVTSSGYSAQGNILGRPNDPNGWNWPLRPALTTMMPLDYPFGWGWWF